MTSAQTWARRRPNRQTRPERHLDRANSANRIDFDLPLRTGTAKEKHKFFSRIFLEMFGAVFQLFNRSHFISILILYIWNI